jgi:hypothetical protein
MVLLGCILQHESRTVLIERRSSLAAQAATFYLQYRRIVEIGAASLDLVSSAVQGSTTEFRRLLNNSENVCTGGACYTCASPGFSEICPRRKR